jgi:uncharacterized protein DUF3846
MATLILASGETRDVVPADGRAFTLPELQGFVGGFIEALPAPYSRVMFLNEDGKRLGLPVNHEATRRVRPWLLLGDVIVGDVVICTLAEAGEETT